MKTSVTRLSAVSAQSNSVFSRTFLLVLLFLFSLMAPVLYSQTSGVQPTQIPGSNSITFVSATNTYKFFHNGILRYEYTVLPGNTTDGGTFKTLKAYADDGSSFLPSLGGVSAVLAGVEVVPWTSGVTFDRINHQLAGGNTVEAYWKMNYEGQYIKYKYKLSISGRTLIIRVEADDEFRNATGVHIARCDLAQSPAAAIVVPYLNLFHILFCNNIFTSFFTDWEISNASQLIPLPGSNFSSGSVHYSQYSNYNPIYDGITNNIRNRVLETLYLTTSPNIEDVFPNVPNPVSPYKEEMANWMLWYYGKSFNNLINQSVELEGELDRLYNSGIKNVWLQINRWQNAGYDVALPCVLPADPNFGGKTLLNSVISRARNQYNYRVGLHQNYVDFYPDANCSPYGWNSNDVALDSYDNFIEAWHNGSTQSYLLKPSKVSEYVNHWTSAIQSDHSDLNGSYLDVHSDVHPSVNYVDYDASVQNPGMFRETLNKYRQLYDSLRTIHNGPVQGEGGNQIFYQGYVDDVDARLTTPISSGMQKNLPVIVDFDMKKLRDKAFVHGVGWYPLFYWEGYNWPPVSRDIVLSYIATELAYGHGSYLAIDYNSMDDMIEYAQLEYKHVFSVQKDYANATPIEILYNDQMLVGENLKTASDFIRSHPVDYKNINSNEFMGQVKIVYDNGLVIYVNRHKFNPWTVNVGVPGGWFNYNANETLDVGNFQTTTYTLPPNNGWLVYDPLKTKVTFTNKATTGNLEGTIRRWQQKH